MAANERAGVMLSVIIPVYNVEKYLNACLDSVISQSFTDYEILLVDDGSTDSSAGLCLEAAAGAPDKIFVFRKENGGASSARNFGLRQASGKYVLFLDSDDHLAPNALETAVKAAESAEADLTVFEAHAFDDETGAASGNYTYSISYPVSDGLSMMKEM